MSRTDDYPNDEYPLPPLYGIAAGGADGEVVMASLALHGSAVDASRAASLMQRIPGATYFVVTVLPAEMDPHDVPDEDTEGGASNA